MFHFKRAYVEFMGTDTMKCNLQVGDLQTSFVIIQKALQAYPGHTGSTDLLKQLRKHFYNL